MLLYFNFVTYQQSYFTVGVKTGATVAAEPTVVGVKGLNTDGLGGLVASGLNNSAWR